MLQISSRVSIPDDEIECHAIRAQGAGGQNVNKVSSAIHLRFDIGASSLPEVYKERLLKLNDSRISKEGVIILKAQRFRTQEKNREDALQRLKELIQQAGFVAKARKPTRPTRSAMKQRLDSKNRQGKLKSLRRKVRDSD